MTGRMFSPRRRRFALIPALLLLIGALQFVATSCRKSPGSKNNPDIHLPPLESASTVKSPDSNNTDTPQVPLVQKASSQVVSALPEVIGPVDFSLQVRPILAEHCFACHGPSEMGRKANLHLDNREGATRVSSSGRPVIIPHDPAGSELIARILSMDTDVMPPKKTGKKLSARQIEVLKKWIKDGAKYARHWAYVPPVDPTPPKPKASSWVRNPLDAFVLSRLEKDGLAPSAEADRATLIRRLSLDLTGLPPKPEEVDAFVEDTSPEAYDRLVDRLLASPHYGERMAIAWLDLARYADTNGGTADNGREMWPYRDWVIRAFNDNMPFDQFTIEQLAGDLLPNSSFTQKVATGFLRNEPIQFEICPDQLSAFLLAERINCVAMVWLGSTFGCAQCHDHKYDPLTQREYYQMVAFFNNHIKDGFELKHFDKRGNLSPVLKLPTPLQTARLAEINERMARVDAAINRLIGATPLSVRDESFVNWMGSLSTRASDAIAAPTTGKSSVPASVQLALRTEERKRSLKQIADIRAYYIEHVHEATRMPIARLRADKKRLENEASDIAAEIPSTMVMDQPRDGLDTHLLIRGEFARKGEKVNPAAPDFLPPLPPGATPDRLGFARWITSPEHPLTARVMVNRIWQSHFGKGLVSTCDDFGLQGKLPTHPELLDWLAVRFVETGWDIKQLHRLIVSSATYRQIGRVTPSLLAVDPENQLYARWSRTRLSAEVIRDNALAIGGVLDERIGGLPVRPYQEEGLWEAVRHPEKFTAQTYIQSHGNDLYRRGIYVFVKRTMPHPSLALFDAPNRDVCTGRRYVTNTALQALALLNDPTVVECARAAATRMYRKGGTNVNDRIAHGFRLCTARHPQANEIEPLRQVYEAELARFQLDPHASAALLAVGESPAPRDIPPAELAALTIVANVLLNLDETITLE